MEIIEKPINVVSDEQTELSVSSSGENDEQLKQLARTYTNLSVKSTATSFGPIPTHVNPFVDKDVDPRLDPYSDKFSGLAWAQHILHITEKNSELYPKRSAGVAFQNLGAYGYGTGTDYQKNVINIVTGLFSKAANIRNKGTKIQILRDFSGVVKPGETCVVLGRPGR